MREKTEIIVLPEDDAAAEHGTEPASAFRTR
jgi:hypothetical protein